MNSLDSLKEWIEHKNSEHISPDTELYQDFGNFFTYLFNHNQDGVCLLDTSLTIICVNTTMIEWYGHKAPFNGRKCYEIYHNRKRPCENCPSLETLKSKKTTTIEVPYETKYSHNGNQRLTTFPVFNDRNEVIAVIEHIRDISTEEKEKEALVKLNSMLDEQSQKMMEQNIALRVLGTQLTDDSHLVINEISMKIDALILPLLEELKKQADESVSPGLIELEQHINSLTIPFLSKLPLDKLKLSKREIQIAEYIREGYTSKEISDKLCISKKTVDFHRANLRKKLKLTDGQSLQSHLLSLGNSNNQSTYQV